MTWDKDIAALGLTDLEKNGLQVFRDYEKAFADEAGRRFVAVLDAEGQDFANTSRVVGLLATEEARVLPMVTCAYADEVLDEMFRANVPDSIPGGRASLFSGFGPLGSLANRTKLAYAFNMVAQPILADVDRLRTVRNKIAHEWDHSRHADVFDRSPLSDLHPAEEHIEWEGVTKSQIAGLEPLARFRVRLIWLVSILTYEAAYRARAQHARLEPNRLLYGRHRPKALTTLATYASRETMRLLRASRSEAEP